MSDTESQDRNGRCRKPAAAQASLDMDRPGRQETLKEILERYKSRLRDNYDCIVPVTGRVESYYQVYVVRKLFGLYPLLVTYDPLNLTKHRIRNLEHIRTLFRVNHIHFSPNPKLVEVLDRAASEGVRPGEPSRPRHPVVSTYPIQMAVRFKVPLIVWGERYLAGLNGGGAPGEMIGFSSRDRAQWKERNAEWTDLANDEMGIDRPDLKWAVFPSDEALERVGVKGVFLGAYLPWDEEAQVQMMAEKYGVEV